MIKTNFLKLEAQHRKFQYITGLTDFIYSGNLPSKMFNPLSELIVIALSGDEMGFLDKNFFLKKNDDNGIFDKNKYLESIKKVHQLIIKNSNLDPNLRLKLLAKEREVINCYLELI